MFWSEPCLGSVYHMISSSCLNLSTNTLHVHIIYIKKNACEGDSQFIVILFYKIDVVAVERDNKIPSVRRVSILIIYYTEYGKQMSIIAL